MRLTGTRVVLAASALGALFLLGEGSASAEICRTNGTFADVDFDIAGVAEVSVDQEMIGNPNGHGVWVCLVPPAQGGGVGLRDANPTNLVGASFEAQTCGTLGCTGVGLTGAEIDTPTTTLHPAGTTTDVGVGTGPATCAYAAGTPTCPGGTPLVTVAVSNGDLPAVTPSGVVVGNDPAVATVTISTPVATVPANVTRQCVGPGGFC